MYLCFGALLFPNNLIKKKLKKIHFLFGSLNFCRIFVITN